MNYYIVDAFAQNIFEGNPAAVCVLEQWLSDDVMQNIAIENNLSETAFTVKEGNHYRLRWLTPGGEIDLCGHATLATAFVLMNYIDDKLTEVTFQTLSGPLTVKKQEDLYEMDFPTIRIEPYELRDDMIEAIGVTPLEVYKGRDLIFVFDSEETVKNLTPDFDKVKKLPEGLAVFVTAKSDAFDFVARAFWPKLNINEDPVCGSMYCSLVPYWRTYITKSELIARQVSKRGGTLYLKDEGDRLKISGHAVLYARGQVNL